MKIAILTIARNNTFQKIKLTKNKTIIIDGDSPEKVTKNLIYFWDIKKNSHDHLNTTRNHCPTLRHRPTYHSPHPVHNHLHHMGHTLPHHHILPNPYHTYFS